MKKIFLVVCSLVVSSIVVFYPLQVKAANDNYYVYLSGNGFMYYPEYVDDNIAYIVSPLMDYDISEVTMINNLAYLGTLNDSKLYQATIQMLIMRYANPNYDVDLKYYNNTKVNNSNELLEIENNLKEYNIDNPLNNKVYEINLNDKLVIEDIDLTIYEYTGYDITWDGNNSIIDGFHKTGLHEIKFKNKLNITDTYYPLTYASAPITNDFTIYVNVLGNKVDFDINLLEDDSYHFTFEMYDLDNNYLGYYLIDKEHNSIYYNLGKNIKLVDVSQSIYKNSDDVIIMEDSTHNYNITLNKEYKNTNFDVLLNNPNNNKIDISIYDSNFGYLKNYRCIDNCSLYLEKNEYIFKDNLNNTYSYYNLKNSSSGSFDGNTIRGIISKNKIDNIYVDNEKIDYDYINGIYKFKDSQRTNKYTIDINNSLVDVELNDAIYVAGYGLFYNYEYIENNLVLDNYDTKNEIDVSIEEDITIKDEVSYDIQNHQDSFTLLDTNEQTNDNVILSIPNTEVNLSNRLDYIIVKKKYNYNTLADNFSC